MIKFTTNPLLWKIRYINGDFIDTAHGASAFLGKAVHEALDVYYGGGDTPVGVNEDATAAALTAMADYIDQYPDGFVKYQKIGLKDKESVAKYASFCLNHYIQDFPLAIEDVVSSEMAVEKEVSVTYGGRDLHLPIKMKGRIDLAKRDKEKRLVLVDHKTCKKFSDPEKVDGAKIIQAVTYYLLAIAELGEVPYSMEFNELKYAKNADGSRQSRTYEIVYEENPLYFDLFFRLYEDILSALNGRMVYVPNFNDLYDGDIGVLAYVNRLDVEEILSQLMKQNQVTNITDVLKKELHKTANMEKLRKTIEAKLSEAKSINYSKMTIPEKIQTKFAEFGIAMRYDSKVEGATVTRYRFNPSTGVRMKTIRSHDADIEQAIGEEGVRVLAPEPGTSFVSFEVPNTERVFYDSAPKAEGLVVPIGKDVGGEEVNLDINDAPHVLIAGATGAGKSVILNSMLNSLEGNADLWLADPKQVELISHPAAKYADEPETIRKMLEDLVDVMDERYLEIKGKGKKYKGRPIVCVIDEFGDLMLENPSGEKLENYRSWNMSQLEKEVRKRCPDYDTNNFIYKQEFVEVLESYDEEHRSKYAHMSAEDLIVKLAQKARAAAIHLIIATQRPSADVITGRIKTNLPTRIALRTGGEVDSRIILDQPGAEKLLGKGDALLLRSDSADFIRFQAYNV